MGNFPGGSAYAMSRDIADGYVLVTERTYQRLLPPELEQLAFEMDRSLRDIRGQQPPLDDVQALQQRNRKIQRLQQALTMLRSHQTRFRRPTAPKPGGNA
jgi:hypothetical protein